MTHDYKFKPAINSNFIKFFYDPLCSLGNLGKHFKRKVLHQAALKNNELVVDVGCGTGVLIREGRKLFPHTTFIGVDPDPHILSIARERLGEEVKLLENYAEKIEIADGSADVVICSLTLHHLPTEAKKKALKEFYRILKPGGKLLIADFGTRRIMFYITEEKDLVKDNLEGRIPLFMTEAQFKNVSEVNHHFPGISIWQGIK